MKLFMLFLMSSFILGLAIRMPRKQKLIVLMGICLGACVGYFFLKQI